jgi:excisionase family DNA binding protein
LTLALKTMDTETQNEVMNGDEAAVFLKMPKSTLLKLCSEGQLPGVKVGRQWRFHRDALEKWRSDRADAVAELPDDSGIVGEPKDFEGDLGAAESRIGRTIKPVVESNGFDNLDPDESGTTSAVRELEEPTRAPRRGGRSASAIELMAQISEKTHGRRGRPPKNRQPAPEVREKVAAQAQAIRETPAPVSKPADDEAVEISRPINRQAAAVPPAPRAKKQGGGLDGVKKLTYWVVVLGVLALAGLGVRSLLVPVSTAPTVASTVPAAPALPEFQVVYKHNEPDEPGLENFAVPTPPPAPEPVAQPAPETAPVAAVDSAIPPAAQEPLAQQPPAPAPEVVQQKAPISTPPPVNQNLEAINRLLPALYNLQGTTITSNNNEVRVVFQEGVFSSGIKIDSTQRNLLANIAEFLAANAPDFWVIIEGQTSSDPVRPGSPFRDNYTMGLRRAVAATEVMREDGGFPQQRLLATSAGGMPPPFDEAEPGSSARNRTVVLRLIPQAGTIPMPGAMAQ